MTTPGQLINSLTAGQFVKLGKASVAGSVEARRLSSGAVMLYWRYTHHGKTLREPLGAYDSSAPPKSITPTSKGFSVAAAFEKAKELAQSHMLNADAGGYAGLKSTVKAAREKAHQEREALKTHTLMALMIDYADHLKALGRRSHQEVRSIIKLHICEAWPEVARLPARQVTPEQIADMMRCLIEAGKGRTANKLRSYTRAAYQTAKAAKTKPSIPIGFKLYAVSSNPAAETETDETHNRTDKNPLSLRDMRTYWAQVQRMDGFEGAVLRLHLLTGGQRIQQLVQLKTEDIHSDGITLFDGKGRPGRPPRSHHLPLPQEARSALDEMKSRGVYAISTQAGDTHLSATTLSRWASDAAKKAGLVGFTAKRIRSGVETALASIGVSQETRGRLQSHGISGVQARHYDGHDYAREKRAALEAFYRLLEGDESKQVSPIRSFM